MLKPETIRNLSPERRSGILSRSMEDVSSVYQDMYAIVRDIASRGDEVNVEHYRKHKDDLKAEDFKVSSEDIENAYKNLDTKVVEALRTGQIRLLQNQRIYLQDQLFSQDHDFH